MQAYIEIISENVVWPRKELRDQDLEGSAHSPERTFHAG
jgi:hypothetical protein